jgi:hypothetical protein
MSAFAAIFVLAGIVAKGLGVIAIIFGAGLVFGVVLTLSLTSRLRRGRR